MAWRRLALPDIVEKMPLGVIIACADGNIEYANARAHALLDAAPGELAGRSVVELRLPERFVQTVISVAEAGGETRCFMHFLQDPHAARHVDGSVPLAYYDALTGLPNRTSFEDRLTRAVVAARRARAGFALLYVDLDRFKTVNETLGYEAGDRVLTEAATRMSRELGPADMLGRLGDDEFGALVEGIASLADASKTATKLLEAYRDPVVLDGIVSVNLSASIGISLYPSYAADAATLMKHAEHALYRAKIGGRNRAYPGIGENAAERHAC